MSKYSFSAKYSLTDSYEQARSLCGKILASAIDGTEREYIFYEDTSDGKLYYLISDDKATSGYSKHLFKGQFSRISDSGYHYVNLYLNQQKCAVALIDYQGYDGKYYTADVLFDYNGNPSIKMLDGNHSQPLIGRSAFCYKGENLFAARYQNEKYIYMGSKQGTGKLDSFKISTALLSENMAVKFDAPVMMYSNDYTYNGFMAQPSLVAQKGKFSILPISKRMMVSAEKTLSLSVGDEYILEGLRTVYCDRESGGKCIGFAYINYKISGIASSSIVKLSGSNGIFDKAKAIWTGSGEKITSLDVSHSIINGVERAELIFLIDKNGGSLRHMYVTLDDKIVSSPLEIAKNVASAHFAVDANEQSVTAFYQNQWSEIFKLELAPDNDNWEEESILTDETDEKIIKQNVYVTRLYVYDEENVPARNVSIRMWSKAHMHLKINGRYENIGPDTYVYVKTDYRGTVVIYHEAYSIAEEDIYIDGLDCTLEYAGIDGLVDIYKYGDNAAFSGLRGSQYIERRLMFMKAQELKDAKVLDGRYMLSDSLRNDSSAMDKASKCINDITRCFFTYAPISEAALSASVTAGKPFIPMGSISAPYENLLASGRQGFIFEVRGDDVISRDITGDEYDEIVASWYAEGACKFWSSIGDFLRSAVKRFVQGIVTVVNVVGKVVKAAITFVLNGVRYVIEQIVEVIQQALDVVETLFVQLAAPFISLLEWLGDPFDFAGMRVTARAIDGTIDQSFIFLKKAAKLARRTIDNGMSNMNKAFDNAIEEMISTIGDRNMRDTNRQIRRFDCYYGVEGSNFIIDNLNSDVNAAQLALTGDYSYVPYSNFSGYSIERADTEVTINVNDILERLKKVTDGLDNTEFNKAVASLNEAVNGDFWGNTTIAVLRLLKGTVDISLSASRNIVGILFDIIDDAISNLWNYLNQKITIPVIGVLYRTIFKKDKMTIRDFHVFLATFTLQMTCRLSTKGRPAGISSEAEVDTYLENITTFVHNFNPDSQNLGFNEATETKNVDISYSDVKDILNCVWQTVSYLSTTISDALTPNGLRPDPVNPTDTDIELFSFIDVVGTVAEMATIICEFSWAVTGFPMKSPSDKYSSYAVEMGMWSVCLCNAFSDMFFGILGLCINNYKSKIIANAVSSIIGTVLGFLYCAFSIAYLVIYFKNNKKNKALEVSSEAMMMLSGITRFCLIKAVYEAVPYYIPLIIAGICDSGSCITGIIKLVFCFVDSSSRLNALDLSDREYIENVRSQFAIDY